MKCRSEKGVALAWITEESKVDETVGRNISGVVESSLVDIGVSVGTVTWPSLPTVGDGLFT